MVIGKLLGGSSLREPIMIGGLNLDFLIFGGALAFITLSHKLKWQPRDIALSGLGLVLAHHLYQGSDLLGHLTRNNFHETRTLVNIAGLLLGFAVMAKLFELSLFGDWLPIVLPDDWKGPALLLIFVGVGSLFLDNIAAAMIGGVIAREVFSNKVTIGYIAAIVAVSNAGGAPSVVGDTTTTMMWIDGISFIDVLHAGVGSLGAMCVIVFFASKQQDKYQRITKDPPEGLTLKTVKWMFLISVFWALGGAVVGNVLFDFPAGGVWVGLLVGSFLLGKGKTPWSETGHIVKETIFILSLVAMASLMPVKQLPTASATVAFSLGWLSSLFDNIPLTAIALKQGGYDWGVLAFSVGFGGSMLWFGSSAGVALCSEFPQGKNVWAWLKQGWFVPVGYVTGFLLMIGVMGWHPHAPHKAGGNDSHSIEHALSSPQEPF